MVRALCAFAEGNSMIDWDIYISDMSHNFEHTYLRHFVYFSSILDLADGKEFFLDHHDRRLDDRVPMIKVLVVRMLG
jgi:hypothetical protein